MSPGPWEKRTHFVLTSQHISCYSLRDDVCRFVSSLNAAKERPRAFLTLRILSPEASASGVFFPLVAIHELCNWPALPVSERVVSFPRCVLTQFVLHTRNEPS